MKIKKVIVVIEGRDSFKGVAIKESITHFLVTWFIDKSSFNSEGEWFPKWSRKTTTVAYE